MQRYVKTAVVTGIAVYALSPAAAETLTFGDRASWTASIGIISGSEDFEGIANDLSIIANPIVLNNMLLSGTAGANPISDTQLVDSTPLNSLSVYSPNGTSYLLADLILGNYIKFDFVSPVRAWGADFTGISNNRVSHLVFRADGGGTIFDLAVPATPASDGQTVERFIGVSSSVPIYSVTFTFGGPGINDAFGVDNIAFVRSVPELPISTLLLAGCFAMVGAVLRQCSSRNSAIRSTAP